MQTRSLLLAFAAALGICWPLKAWSSSAVVVMPLVSETQRVLVPATLGIIVNANDPQSLELGRQYAAIRDVPLSNIIELNLPRVNYVVRHLMVRELEKLRGAASYNRLVGFALAFDKPYRVDANQSITSVIADGIVPLKWVGNCNITPESPDAGARPGAEFFRKPAMLLYGGGDLSDSLALAKRGQASDATDPSGDIFLIKTADSARSGPREASMDRAKERFGQEIGITVNRTQTFAGQSNILGFQIGLAVLNNLDSLHFLPGAFADHLTSFGGAIFDKRSQTPITALIKAGATASYGTVREPCNYAGKFPDPERLINNYLRGDSILEAYWKSVDMPTEGLFIGEPLARPFPVVDATIDGGLVTLKANRHTEGFLLGNQADNSSGQASVLTKNPVRLAIYDVESGTPEFIKELPIGSALKPGDVVGSFSVDSASAAHLMLGALRKS
ncbi:TIGR03790 family protein [Oryzifoliimicrobium ureilyticus]|uniref:TIGR03790 family protein n=1 Tax=Oryzifoliimicrobium ureilyticus TaxID=3113724 RepID=UPI003075F54D